MKEKVYKVGCSWEYIQDPDENEVVQFSQSEEFDDAAFVSITDRSTQQVCIIKKEDRYGIYTLDYTYGFGGPGVWCSPTVNPFPYDEVKYCTFPWDKEYGVFAFRIGEKWGILKVVDGDEPFQGLYDVEYLLTMRRIVVECLHPSIAEAELQLEQTFDWQDPFPKHD